MEKFPWEVGKHYYTKGSLVARITSIKHRSIPKELTSMELERLMANPHYGIEGYVMMPSEMNNRHRTEWTMGGIHSLDPEATGVADLTTKRFYLPGEEEEEGESN